jgi:hypothetical protein
MTIRWRPKCLPQARTTLAERRALLIAATGPLLALAVQLARVFPPGAPAQQAALRKQEREQAPPSLSPVQAAA